MLQTMPCCASSFWQASAAYCTPRSEWCIRPAAGARRSIAICSAATTSAAEARSLIDQPTMRREKMSIVAARYSQPSSVARYVMSETQTAFGLVVVKHRFSRFSATGW
jgi:hypothetical protein